jgi:hypothetical protein
VKFALYDVPGLREVVPVQRKGRARRVFEKSRIGFRWTFQSWVKQEFGDLAAAWLNLDGLCVPLALNSRVS